MVGRLKLKRGGHLLLLRSKLVRVSRGIVHLAVGNVVPVQGRMAHVPHHGRGHAVHLLLRGIELRLWGREGRPGGVPDS